MPQLSVSQQLKVNRLIADRQHPDVVESFLVESGFSDSHVAEFYADSNLTRSRLLDRHRMKRKVRFVGLAIAACAFGLPLVDGPIVVSVGLLVYGIAIAATGSLTIYQP